MDGYRIRRGGVEKRVGDDAALKALVAAGGLRPTDEIATATGWIRAEQHPIVRGALAAGDPWAAWSDVDSVDAAPFYRRMVAPAATEDGEVTELPLDALTPVPEPALRPVARPERVLPEAAPAAVPLPLPETPRGPRSLNDPGRPRLAPVPAGLLEPLPEDGAEVIDFPRARPRPGSAGPDLLLTPASRSRGPPPLVRTSRVLAMVIAGLSFVLLGYMWIRMSAYTGAAQGLPVARASDGAAPVVPPASPLVAMDEQLRAALPTQPRDVKEAGDLSDALLVELVQQRLEIIEANGLVTKWIGKKGDEPKSAEVRISYRSAGDLTRELGAIALVVGRYKRFYRLDMPVFEVTEVGARGVTRIRAEDAEAYYQARMSLEQLLRTITGD